jgi:AcrR family transcriptional regulator
MAETALRLRSTARALTIDRGGLAGFTIEELCSEVGVSRRTFFNYFASKENAVIGIPAHAPEDHELTDRFLAAGGQLLDDLIDLVIGRWELLGLTADEATQIGRAFEREPRLLVHLIGLIGEAERSDVELIERREGWGPGDERAQAAVQLLGSLMRANADTVFGGVEPYRVALHRRLDAIHSLFTSSTASRKTT